MAGFEVVVRPAVFPNIRPAPTRSLPPTSDDPTKGVCVIRGSSGKTVDLPFSWSASTSRPKPIETERRVDEVTVYQQNDDGTVNKKNFVKLKVANKITMRQEGDPVPNDPTSFSSKQFGEIRRPNFYARAQPAPNIEIGATNIVEKNPDVPQ